MSTRWIQFVECFITSQNGRTRFREWCYSMMTWFCSKKNYEQTGTKATEIHSHHSYSSIVPSIHFVPFNASNSRRNWAKFGVGVKLIAILRHNIAYFSINIRWHSQNVSSDSRKWLSKHGAKGIGHVKMAGPGFVNDATAWWPGFVPKKITNKQEQKQQKSIATILYTVIQHFHNSISTISLISQLIYDDIAKMFHLTAGNG
jgi:hypothetical protein